VGRTDGLHATEECVSRQEVLDGPRYPAFQTLHVMKLTNSLKMYAPKSHDTNLTYCLARQRVQTRAERARHESYMYPRRYKLEDEVVARDAPECRSRLTF
jgi:hypothetical protein